jgi:rubredoxin
MASEIERSCPECNAERTFYRAASTELHLGLKTKWRCPDCGYGFVRVDGDVDTSDASA